MICVWSDQCAYDSLDYDDSLISSLSSQSLSSRSVSLISPCPPHHLNTSSSLHPSCYNDKQSKPRCRASLCLLVCLCCDWCWWFVCCQDVYLAVLPLLPQKVGLFLLITVSCSSLLSYVMCCMLLYQTQLLTKCGSGIKPASHLYNTMSNACLGGWCVVIYHCNAVTPQCIVSVHELC